MKVTDRRRFERIYADGYEPVLRYFLRRSNREDALDAAAETFAVAWRRRDQIPHDRPLPWLYGVARRVLANQRRSAGRRRTATAYLSVVRDGPPDGPEPQLVRDEEFREVNGALHRLRDADQEIIQLAAWERLARDDLAAALQCSPNAVTKRLNRALDRLGRQMGISNRPPGRFFAREETSG